MFELISMSVSFFDLDLDKRSGGGFINKYIYILLHIKYISQVSAHMRIINSTVIISLCPKPKLCPICGPMLISFQLFFTLPHFQ